MRPPRSRIQQLNFEAEEWLFVRSLNSDSRAYRNVAMELIFLCRSLVQVYEQGSKSYIQFRNVLIAADDALKSAAEAGEKSFDVDKKFEETINLLSAFENDFPSMDLALDSNISGMVTRKMSDKSESPSAILDALRMNLRANSMGDERTELTRAVEFHLFSSLPDTHPIVVKQILSDTPSLQEILWNFSRFKDEKKRLTLRGNPHFYEELPTSPDAYRDSLKIDPTEDFRHANKFYVLSDKPELIYIMSNRVLQSFGNFWCPENAIIFKDIRGRLRGESIIDASLRGTYCGICERLLVSTVPRVSRNRCGLQPIITEGCPWMIGCLPIHSSADIGFCVCIGRAAPDSPLQVPLPPTSEQPEYSVAYRTYIHKLDNDSLLQIFSHYRLIHEENWSFRLTWRKLVHVCRRWRYLIYDSWSHLDMCLLLTNESPPIATLRHLPPLPLVIDYSDTRTKARKDGENMHHGLQWHGHVCRVTIRAPSSSLREWLELMNRLFPRLRDLSLLSTTIEEMNLTLPETFQAPDLRRLSLHGIGLPIRSPLLPSMIALSTLTLTHIGASSYFSPGRLITQLQGLLSLDELSIGFAIPIPFPSNERELISTPIPPVTLPNLRRLMFRGVSVYLDNLVSQINTPLLEQLSLSIFFELAFTLVNLAKFIHRTEGFGCLVARVVFNKASASINVDHYEQRDIGKLKLHVNCKRLDWQIDSAAQICSALGKVLSSVEDLTLDLNLDEMPPDWEDTLDNMLWHELLLPFVGVKKLHIGSSLTFELSQEPVSGGLLLDFLPGLQELDVQLVIDHAKKAFSAFLESRESEDRPVHLLAPPRPHVEPDARPDRRQPWPQWPDSPTDSLNPSPSPSRSPSFPEKLEHGLETNWPKTKIPPPKSRGESTDALLNWEEPVPWPNKGSPRPESQQSLDQGESAESLQDWEEPDLGRPYYSVPRRESPRRRMMALPRVLRFDQVSFSEYMTRVGKPHLNQAMNLISICQTFIQAQEQTFHSYYELRSVFQVIDDALSFAAMSQRKTSKEVEIFEKAIDALNDYEKRYHPKRTVGKMMAAAKAKDKPSTILNKLKEKLRSSVEQRTVVVEFLIRGSLLDHSPTIVKLMLGPHAEVSEVLWTFNCLSLFEESRNHLPLQKNPHFYKNLPASPKAYGAKFRMEPIQNFQHEVISIQVLIDNSDHAGWVSIETAGQVRLFCNVWLPNDAIIFQDVRGNFEGEGIIGAAIQRIPDLWCFEERLLSLTSQPAFSPNPSRNPISSGIIQITSAGEPKSDWREPIRRMLQSRDINICFTDNPLSQQCRQFIVVETA